MDHPYDRDSHPDDTDTHCGRSIHGLRCAHDVRIRMLVRSGEPAEPPTQLLHQIATAIHRHCGYSLFKSHRLAWNLGIEQAVAAVHLMCRDQRLGARGLTERSWKHWETGEHPGPDYQDLLCRLFRTNPVGLGFASDYSDYSTRIPDTPARRGPAPATHEPRGTGDPRRRLGSIERWVTMAADESAQLGDHTSNVGQLTLDRLRTDAVTLARRFATAPRLELFDSAVHLRDRIFTLLSGRQRIAESRELYFLAAASLGMLAEATDDLGYPGQAMTHIHTALLCAGEAGHPDLTAWLLGEQSLIAHWDGRSAQAVAYARQGQTLGAAGTAAAWLCAHEARAAAALGDRDAATDALHRARDARERMRPDVLDTEYGGILSFSTPKQHHYGGATWLSVGDGGNARQDAESAISGYQQGPPEARARDNEAISHINIALAHVLDEDLDAAGSALTQALDIPPELRVANLDRQLRRLHGQVTEARYHRSASAVSIRDRIEDYLTTPAPSLPPG